MAHTRVLLACDVNWHGWRVVAHGLGAKLGNHVVKEAVDLATDLLIRAIGDHLDGVLNEDLKIWARSLDVGSKCVGSGFDGLIVKYKREPIVECLKGGFDPVKD